MRQICEKPSLNKKDEKEEIQVLQNSTNNEKDNAQEGFKEKNNVEISDEIPETKEMDKDDSDKKGKDIVKDKENSYNGIMSETNNNHQTKNESQLTQEIKTKSQIPSSEKPEEKNSKNSIPNPPQLPKIEKKEPVKQLKFPKIVKQKDSDFSSSSSSSDDDFSKREEQRLRNIKLAQENLFKKACCAPRSRRPRSSRTS